MNCYLKLRPVLAVNEYEERRAADQRPLLLFVVCFVASELAVNEPQRSRDTGTLNYVRRNSILKYVIMIIQTRVLTVFSKTINLKNMY